jgi:hypothetical protein
MRSKEGSASKKNYGGSVTVVMDIKAFTLEVIKIRYDYNGSNKY